MLFREIIGQNKYKQILTDAVDENRLSHALLFLAPEGAGGLPLALALAQYLVCTNRQSGESCGKCPGCKKAAQFIHPDIHFTYPVVSRKAGEPPISADYAAEWRDFLKGNPYGNVYQWLQYIKAGNRQGNITARECARIIHHIGLKSYESDYKVMIIWDPESLGKEGNRLLKSLEEPPDKTIFILVASQMDLILNTILSRTQLLRLPGLKEDDVIAVLKRDRDLPEEDARRVAALSEGNYNTALQMLGNDTSAYLGKLKAWLNAILKKDPLALKNWIGGVIGEKMGREELKQFLKYFIKQLEYAVRICYLGNDRTAMLPDERLFVQNLLKLADVFQLKEMMDKLNEACYYVERNANDKLLFHALSIQLKYIFKREPLMV